MTPKTERFEMRLDESTLDRVDEWRAKQPGLPSRAEAIRRLIEHGLTQSASGTVKLSDGEKLLALMLRDVYKHLDIKSPGINPELVESAICGGHSWALGWELSGVYHGHEDDPRNLTFVLDVLDLWDHIERAQDGFSDENKARVAKEAEPFGERAKFAGFDGNNEAELMSIARFLVEDLGRFARFKGRRSFNSHAPMTAVYQRMLAVFKPMQRTLAGSDLSATQVIEILKAMRHPER